MDEIEHAGNSSQSLINQILLILGIKTLVQTEYLEMINPSTVRTRCEHPTRVFDLRLKILVRQCTVTKVNIVLFLILSTKLIIQDDG